MKKKRRGYIYNSDYGSGRDIVRAVKKLYHRFKFKKKRNCFKYKIFCDNLDMGNPIGKLGSIEIPLDSIGDCDEEESDN